MCFAPQRRALFQHLNFQKWREHVVFCTFWLGNVLRATTACTFSTSQLPKVARTPGVLYILTSKCASRHNGVHFFDSSTSKSGPNPWCFVHFDFKMCFAQNVQNTPGSDHFWKLRCRKSVRRCGAKHILKSKCTKQNVRATFGGSDVEKVHAVVARSRFRSQNVQNTICSRHFWRFGCWKSVRRCGAKHISKSKCTTRHMFAPLLEVRMLKKCTPLWREAHFEVKMYKAPHVRATFGGSDVEKVHAVVARSTSRSQNAQNTAASDHFWKLRCRKSARRCGVKMYKTLGVRTTFGGSDVAFASRHNTTEHYTTLHSSTLHYTTLHSSTLHYTKLHYTTLHYTEWHCNTDRQVDS